LASLCFGLLGLAAHGRRPARADAILEEACASASSFGPRSYTDALAALAALPRDKNPLMTSRED
jgi:hypothetical protein